VITINKERYLFIGLWLIVGISVYFIAYRMIFAVFPSIHIPQVIIKDSEYDKDHEKLYNTARELGYQDTDLLEFKHIHGWGYNLFRLLFSTQDSSDVFSAKVERLGLKVVDNHIGEPYLTKFTMEEPPKNGGGLGVTILALRKNIFFIEGKSTNSSFSTEEESNLYWWQLHDDAFGKTYSIMYSDTNGVGNSWDFRGKQVEGNVVKLELDRR
jgi:hypothetical protein